MSKIATKPCVVDVLDRRGDEIPNDVVYTFLLDGESAAVDITFRQLRDEARAIAAKLSELVEPGARAIVMYPPGPDFFSAFWGCLFAGVVPVVAYPPSPQAGAAAIDVFAAMYKDSGASLVLSTEAVSKAMSGWPAWAARSLPVPIVPDLSVPAPSFRPRPTKLAYLQYTSGSTASPKGVMVTHSALSAQCESTGVLLNFHAETAVCVWLPLHHTYGLIVGVMMPVVWGVRGVHMSPMHFVERPLRWVQMMDRYKIQNTGGPAFGYDLLSRAVAADRAKAATFDLSKLKFGGIGGEAVLPETLARGVAELVPLGMDPRALKPCYGLSEALLTVTCDAPDAESQLVKVDSNALARGKVRIVGAGEDKGATAIVGVGVAAPGVEVRIVDTETSKPCPPDRVGEIWVRGPTVAGGYWEKPEETEAVFGGVVDGVAGYLRTGDLGFLLDGQLFICGRSKEIMIVRGLNYFPADIEAAVRHAAPELEAAPVAAFPYSHGGVENIGIAVEAQATAQEMVSKIRAQLAAELRIPCGYVALVAPGSLPRTGSGKLKRSVIAGMASRSELRGLIVVGDDLAVTLGGQHVAQWGWEALVEVLRSVGATIPPDLQPASLLRDVGFDSLAIVRAVSEVELRYGLRLPMEALAIADGCVGDLITLAKTPTDADAPRPLRYLEDAVLSPALHARVSSAATKPKSTAAPRVLLTGGTGFLGANLALGLLETNQARLDCIVRASDVATARSRLAAAVLQHAGKPLPSSDRLRVWCGDVTQDNLGLSARDYAELAGEIDTVAHSAAHVNFAYPYEILKRTNVAGTERVLDFCAAGRLKRLHHMSTLGVLATGNIHGPERAEAQAIELEPRLEGGYEQSKWVADRLVTFARAAGLPVSSYRIGYVGGDSGDGARLRTQEFYPALLKGCIQLGAFPDVDAPVPLIPIDWVVRVIVDELMSARDDHADFHLVPSAPMTASQAFRRLVEHGYPMKGVSFEAWTALRLSQPRDEFRRSALYDYAGYLQKLEERHFRLPPMRFENTQRIWKTHPTPDAIGLLDVYVRRMIDAKYLAPSGR